MKTEIPSLGQTAQEVLKNALNINTAGYLLKFKVIFEGDWQFNAQTGKFERTQWQGNIPTCSEETGAFDDWLLCQISKGYVGIFVESTGRKPFYSKEYHRSTARVIPME